jgi:glycosyltransferase involved in cell wall biosynthesis
MNVLVAVPWDQSQGGVSHVAASVASRLEERGHNALYFFPANSWRLETHSSRRGFRSARVRLRSYPAADQGPRARLSWRTTTWTALPQIVRFARRHRIDVINVHYPTSGFALLVDAAETLGIPLVVSAHGSDLLTDAGPTTDAGVHRLLDAAARVIVPSRSFRDDVIKAFPALREKTLYIYNGYDARELEDSSSAPARAPSDPSIITALCIAAQIPKKGIDILLRAVHEAALPNLRLRLIGEGELRAQLEQLAGELGIADRVTFIGSLERAGVFVELRAADLLVMSSRHPSESFGLAALEAMASGKPVIASAIGGLREVVDPEVTGLLVPPENPSMLAEAIVRRAGDPGLRARFAEAGRTRAQQFTADKTADAYEQLFRQLIAERAISR